MLTLLGMPSEPYLLGHYWKAKETGMAAQVDGDERGWRWVLVIDRTKVKGKTRHHSPESARDELEGILRAMITLAEHITVESHHGS